MEKTGLVLEGGGLRGIFTAGVLDLFLEQDISFDYVVGVSAGACHACSYLAKQHGRAFKTAVDYIGDRHYCSMYSLITTGDLFGVKMLYEDIPRELYPIDNETFLKSSTRFDAVATNCLTGKAEYLQVKDLFEDIINVRASSSMPLVSRTVYIKGEPYLDGGIADSIPVRRAMAFGCTKNVVVLTQHRDYVKPPNEFQGLSKLRYRKYPALVKAMEGRHEVYNATLELIYEQEAAGELIVIQPEAPLGIGRTEKDRAKLTETYNKGHAAAESKLAELRAFLGN